MEKTGKFTIKNDQGKEMECEVLFTFDSDETKKSYIVFTDNTIDGAGNVKVYANTYDPEGKNMELGLIETKEEWDVIEKLLTSLQEEMSDEDEESGV